MRRRELRTEIVESIEGWPRVDTESIKDPGDRKTFVRRERAFLSMKMRNHTLTDIAKTAGLSRKALRQLAVRTLKRHKDGKVWGFRALVPRTNVSGYEREALPTTKASKHGGDAGAFTALLRKYSELPRFIEKNLFRRGESGQLQLRKSVKRFHRTFLDELKRLGVKKTEYPLSRRDGGLRSLYAYVRKLEAEDVLSTLARGDSDIAELYARRLANCKGRRPVMPYELVEGDGHELKLNVYFDLERPDGKKVRVYVPRLWVVAMLEVYSGALLGYSVSPYENYNAHDVLSAIASALYGRAPDEPLNKIPDSNYPGRSLPVELVPELKGVCFDVLSLDNALSHTAKDVTGKTTTIVGAAICRGPSYVPEFRNYVERAFKTLRESLGIGELKASRRGRHARRRSDSFADAIALERVLALLDGVFWQYNCELRTEAALGRTPLEALCDVLHDPFVRKVSSEQWGRAEFMTRRMVKRVAGNPEAGRPLYVEFADGRYSGPALNDNPGLRGEEVVFEYNEDNVAFGKVFLSNGHEAGILEVGGRWAGRAHSLRLRRHIAALMHRGDFQPPPGLDFVTAFENHCRELDARLASRTRATLAERKAAQVRVVIDPDIPSSAEEDSASEGTQPPFKPILKKRKVLLE